MLINQDAKDENDSSNKINEIVFSKELKDLKNLSINSNQFENETLDNDKLGNCIRKKSEDSFDDQETNYVSVEDNATVSGIDLGELTIDSRLVKAYRVGRIFNDNFNYYGEIVNNRRSGFGFCMFKNNEYYIGQWKNNKMIGLGKLRLKNGETYEGEFENNEPNGYIEHETEKAITIGIMKGFKFVEGEIICKKKNKYTIEARISYIGENIFAVGTINDYAGNLYEGEMLNLNPNGWGIQRKKDKFVYKGQQDKGFNGYGEVYCVDGSKYFGFFKNNKKHGIVINFNVKEERISFAKYLEDSKNGATLNVHKNGLKVEIWHNGYRVKLIENFDLAKKYINSCYPEHEWILKLDYMKMINYFGKLN